MKKLTRLILLFLGLAVALAGITALGIKIFLPAEKAKALLQSQLESRLRRQVELGTVSVGFFSGVRVDGFKLSEKPDFQAGTFISSDRFSVRVNWPALLLKKIVLHSLELNKPMVNVIRLADGVTYNFSDLVSSSTGTAASAGATPAESSNISLLIVKAMLTDGRLSFVDKSPKNQSAAVEDLNLTVRNIGLTAPLDLKGGCKIQTKGQMFRIDLEANATLKGDTAIKRASIESGVSRVELSGRLGDLFADNPSFDLTLALKNIETSLLVSLGAVPDGLQTAGMIDGNATVNGSANSLIYSVDLILDKVKLVQPGSFVKNAGSPMRLAAKGTIAAKTDVAIDSFSLTLGKFVAEGDGRLKDAGAPNQHLSLRLTTDEFSPAELLGYLPSASLPTELKLTGTLKMNLGYEGTSDKGQVTLKLTGPALDIVYGENFHKFAGTAFSLETSGIYSTPTAFSARSLSLALARINLNGTASYTSQGTGSYQADLHSNTFPLEDIDSLVSAAKPYALKGQGRLSAKVASGKNGLSYQASVALEKAGLTYEQAHITDLNTSLTATPDSILLPSLSGRLDGAAFKASAKAVGLETKPVITLTANAEAVDLSKLMPPEPAAGDKSKPVPPPVPATPAMFSKPLSTTGKVSITKLSHEYFNAQSAVLAWNLTGVTPEMDRVNGTASLRTGAGGLTKSAQGPKSSLGKVLLTPLTIVQKLGKVVGGAASVPSLEKIKFHDVIGDYSLQNGVLTVQKFNLNGTDAQADMTGTAELAAGQRLNLKASLRGKSEATAVHIKITGTLSDPKIGLDAAAQGKQVIQSIKEGAADGLLEHLGLPGLANHSKPKQPEASSENPAPADQSGSNAAQPAPTAEDNTQQKPEKQLENLLKGLIKH